MNKEMGADWTSEVSKGKYISTKIGSDITLTNISISKNLNPKYQPISKAGMPQGFCFEFKGDEGVISATTYSLQGALRDAGVKPGDTINIKHPSEGVYKVKIVSRVHEEELPF